MWEDPEDVEEESLEVPKEKRRVYKFRYGHQPSQPCHFEGLLDYQAIDFDHKALRSDDPQLIECVEENTLLLIKPSAMRFKEEIRKRLHEEGYTTLKEKTLWLDSELMSEFYNEHYGKPWFPKFILKMVSGPVHIMILAKYNAIEDLKKLMGSKKVEKAKAEAPYSLRAMYGMIGDSATNGVHGSNTSKDAQREIRFFFPQAIPEPMPEVLKFVDYIQENMYNTVLEGIRTLKNEKPYKPIPWLSNWFLYNSKETPILEPDNLMTSYNQ